MHPKNRAALAHRVTKAAEASLAAQDYVSCIDVLVGIGWLDPEALKRWRQGQIEYLERVVQSNLPRISEAMKMFRSWAAGKGLLARETAYVARAPQRRTLRFSRSGDPTIERLYRDRLDFTRADRKKARTPRGKGQPCTGTRGHPANE